MRINLMILMVIIILYNSAQPRRENFKFLKDTKRTFINHINNTKYKLRKNIGEILVNNF